MISPYNSDYQWCSLQLQCCSVAHWYSVLFGDITLITCNVSWSDYFVLEWWCLLNLLMFSLLWRNNLLPLLAMSFPFNTKLKYTFTKFFVQRSIYLSLINVKLMSFKSYSKLWKWLPTLSIDEPWKFHEHSKWFNCLHEYLIINFSLIFFFVNIHSITISSKYCSATVSCLVGSDGIHCISCCGLEHRADIFALLWV